MRKNLQVLEVRKNLQVLNFCVYNRLIKYGIGLREETHTVGKVAL
jgi:hypothetical protein